MDRSIHRFLCLPIFDDDFRSVLRQLGLDHVEYWLALAGDESAMPDEKISALLPALTGDQDILDKMLVRLDMVNLLAAMVARSAAKVKAEIAADLGYGYAEPPRVGSKRPASSVEHSVPLSTVVDPKPVGLGSQVEVASIQEAESGEKKKWGMRLQQICQRAGTAAAINDPAKCAGLQPAEAARLKALAFEAGGFRTIRQNVRNWEKFEEWAVAHNLMQGVSAHYSGGDEIRRPPLRSRVWSGSAALVQICRKLDLQAAGYVVP